MTKAGWKPEEEPRLAVDYRYLNSQSLDHQYCLPRVDDLVRTACVGKIFTLADLKRAFFQIGMDQESQSVAAISTQWGTYCVRSMPFGLRGSPSTQQQHMDTGLGDLKGKIVEVYLDDVLIYTTDECDQLIGVNLEGYNFKDFKSVEELHQYHVRMVFRRLQEIWGSIG